MKLDYYHQKVNVLVASRHTERLKTWDLRNWEISRKSLKCLDWYQIPSHPPKSQILTIFGKNLPKISCKKFHKNPYFLSDETDFHLWLGPDPLILHFLKILVFQKAHLLFKLIDIFQKTLFCTLESSMNLGLNAVPVAAG